MCIRSTHEHCIAVALCVLVCASKSREGFMYKKAKTLKVIDTANKVIVTSTNDEVNCKLRGKSKTVYSKSLSMGY